MKTIFTFLIVMLFTSALIAQVPNGGFENWTEGEPDEWTTSNVGAITTISQTEISHSGNYAVKGQTDPGETIIPELISGYDGYGVPISENYGQLAFHYIYIEDGSDKMVIAVIIADEDYVTLGSGGLEIEDATETFTLAVVPIEYSGTGTAAHAIIQIALVDAFGSGPPSVDSHFIIDDVVFSGGVGIDESVIAEVNVYPNPVTDFVNIETNEDIKEISIFNSVGQMVYTNKATRGLTKVDMSEHHSGLYFIRMESTNGIITRKVVNE